MTTYELLKSYRVIENDGDNIVDNDNNDDDDDNDDDDVCHYDDGDDFKIIFMFL